MLKKIFFIIIFYSSLLASSKYDEYFKSYGEHFGIPPILLKNIAKVESNLNPHCINKNLNGTIDYGIMQINSIHFIELSRYGINHTNIMDPKINIMAGAILVQNLTNNKLLSYDNIGVYHSKTPYFKKLWVQKLNLEIEKSR